MRHIVTDEDLERCQHTVFRSLVYSGQGYAWLKRVWLQTANDTTVYVLEINGEVQATFNWLALATAAYNLA